MGEQVNPFDEASSVADNPKTASIGSSVIPIVNRLQDIFAPLGGSFPKINLPQVAVIGSQSSGKSSVLEALVGRDFLPRGSDICTRRPLVLQLEHRPRRPNTDDDREWGEFLHLPEKRFYDFSAIRREIQAETEREAGTNKGVSDKQIRLKISSPNVLNITLVDLPGMTKVPVGDQPSDIEARIRTMIMSYIKHETCVILAVSPANSDLATSDALQMARAADPAGSRTIGVITKLDIMDRGTDARNFLLGRVIPLRLGYIGVVNRSQEDINQDWSIVEALNYEENFFHNHPVYHGLSDQCGIPQLANKLNKILEQHIRTVLPRLKAELNSQMVAVVKEIRTYGEDIESKAEQGAVLLNILTRFCKAFSHMLDGRSREMSTTELSGGARIHYIFESIFVKSLEEVDPCDGFTDKDIQTAIENATGPKDALFVPDEPFEVLIRRQIARLLDPSLQCLRFVYEELIKMSRACEATEMQRFPVLRRSVDEVMGKFLCDGVKPAERMIANIVEMEMDYINTSHPNFLSGSKAVELAMQHLKSTKGSRPQLNNDKPPSSGNSTGRTSGISSLFGGSESRISSGGSSSSKSFGEPMHDVVHLPTTVQLREPPALLRLSGVHTEQQELEIIVIKLLLRSYYDIVRKKIQDFVPKAIMHFLVNHTKRNLLSTFIQKLYRENLFEEMLHVQDDTVVKRKRTREMFQVLQQAVQTLEEVDSEVTSRSSISSSSIDTATGLPKIQGLSSPIYTTSNSDISSHTPSLNSFKSHRLLHSWE
ncbi:PREDICTED: dynamin-related protein 3A-like isoform X3 [Nelumbo nucifera]|uniref:Dynamin-related protein 3A-like isoform X3 n=1 Tax=Nelumbo nucifera TaxID=4432 RepID=A0A1U8AL49_NELNU|nr:PREDICTED: dynamin-related protein 3A-like isoform X3 [Nelumbo nucifera]